MKNEPDFDRLLDDILEETSSPAFRAEMLEQTLRQVRRRRQVRQWNQRLAAMAIIVMAGLLAWRMHAPKTRIANLPGSTLDVVSSRPLNPPMIVESSGKFLDTITTSSSTIAIVETRSTNGGLRELNDEDLLAMVKGEPAMLIRQSPHEAELLVVDSGAKIPRRIGERGAFQP